jgi:hypothetical protein
MEGDEGENKGGNEKDQGEAKAEQQGRKTANRRGFILKTICYHLDLDDSLACLAPGQTQHMIKSMLVISQLALRSRPDASSNWALATGCILS